jgi:hypothetical protein
MKIIFILAICWFLLLFLTVAGMPYGESFLLFIGSPLFALIHTFYYRHDHSGWGSFALKWFFKSIGIFILSLLIMGFIADNILNKGL